jgi:hypothetical protein
MTTINENGQLHRCWATQLTQSIESCSDSSSRKEHIVNQDHVFTLNTAGWNLCAVKRSGRPHSKIVAMKCYIQ